MRKSKTRKTERKAKAKANAKQKQELKANKEEAVEKYKAWQNLPIEEWSEARKKYLIDDGHQA